MSKTVPEPVFDSEPSQDYAADLYSVTGLAESIDSLDAFDDAALQRYEQDGYLAIENAFTPAEVQAALSGLDDLVMGRREGFDGVSFESKARDILPTLPLEGRLDAVRKFWKFADYEPRLKAISEHPKLLTVLHRILGETPHMFQDMALVKPPKIGREKPWHQDHAYFDFPLGTRIVGVWIALDEATVENGCMRVLSQERIAKARASISKNVTGRFATPRWKAAAPSPSLCVPAD